MSLPSTMTHADEWVSVLVLTRLKLMPSAEVQADALWLMQTPTMVSLYSLRPKQVRFFASAFEVISFNACISALEKTGRWTQALLLLRHLPGGLCTNSSCSQLPTRMHKFLWCFRLQTKTRPHVFTQPIRLPSSIGSDIQCIHQCLHLDWLIYQGRGFCGETMWNAIWHTFYDITLCLWIFNVQIFGCQSSCSWDGNSMQFISFASKLWNESKVYKNVPCYALFHYKALAASDSQFRKPIDGLPTKTFAIIYPSLLTSKGPTRSGVLRWWRRSMAMGFAFAFRNAPWLHCV